MSITAPPRRTAETSLERRGGDEATRQPIRSADLQRATMTHILIQEALDGKAVDWMEKASDQQIPQVTKEIYGTNIRVNCPLRRVQTE